ncbi:conserved membrane hypothetical protein [Vibrio chagasii]|nr:conserved membrane hypothetical protein [Vibrio chagasii]CAH7422698.1 conserved membrane hypothetical protein [Vibrio chagasii]
MGVVLIAVVLVTGYLFSSQHLPSKYKLNRTDGWHSYFFVAYQGVVFSTISASLCAAVDYFNCISLFLESRGYLLSDLDNLFLNITQIKTTVWALTTVVLAQLKAWITVVYYKLRPNRASKRIQKLIVSHPLESFIFEAAYEGKLVMVTMSTRKTYVGFCLGNEFTNGEVEFISLLPYLSGYREKDILTFEHTTNYRKHYQEQGIEDGSHPTLNANDFRIIIPTGEIESYSYFDIDTYVVFKKEEKHLKSQALSNNTYPDLNYSKVTINQTSINNKSTFTI